MVLKKAKTYNQFGEEIIHIPRFEEEAGFYATKKSSATMKKIKSENNINEVKLRKTLWALGYRYRVNVKHIPGKPDLVFLQKKVAVFIDGDFWHGYNWAAKKEKLQTNKAYWIPKIERNMQRDKEVTFKLLQEGWTVLRLWEHEVKKSLDYCVQKIIDILESE